MLPLAQAHMNRARELLAAGGGDKLALAEAEAEARTAAQLSPRRTDAWLTLARIDSKQGRGSGAVISDLERSYGLAPLDPDVMAWRVRVALELWPQLPDALKAKVDQEILAGWTQESARRDLRRLATEVHDQSGRQHLADRIAQFDRNPPSLPKAHSFVG
jgi:hypothetical protein